MAKLSAGILLYRLTKDFPEVMLIHPGGPFWAKKDEGAWSIPKGEPGENEDLHETAIRELKEETGIIASGEFLELEPIRQKAGKTVYCWALEHDADVTNISGNHFEMEWPPRSGKLKSFPEVDKADWFDIPAARKKILAGQLPLLEELETKLKKNSG